MRSTVSGTDPSSVSALLLPLESVLRTISSPSRVSHRGPSKTRLKLSGALRLAKCFPQGSRSGDISLLVKCQISLYFAPNEHWWDIASVSRPRRESRILTPYRAALLVPAAFILKYLLPSFASSVDIVAFHQVLHVPGRQALLEFLRNAISQQFTSEITRQRSRMYVIFLHLCLTRHDPLQDWWSTSVGVATKRSHENASGERILVRFAFVTWLIKILARRQILTQTHYAVQSSLCLAPFLDFCVDSLVIFFVRTSSISLAVTPP